MVRFILLNIVLASVSIHLMGQENFVNLEISPKTVETGQVVYITIKTNVDGNIDMEMPDGFITSGVRQSGMSSSVEVVNGVKKTIGYSFQSFSGYFEKEGKYSFGPAKVYEGKKEHRSETYIVKVVKPQNMISENPHKNLNQLIFGIIEQSKKEIYEGESIVLEGKVYSQVEVLQVENFEPFTIESPADSRLLDNANQITVKHEEINGKKLQTFKIGKTLIFPEKVGKFTVKPFQTIIAYTSRNRIFPDRIKVVSNTTDITVKPLPPGVPDGFIDAVGKFTVSAQINNTQLNQGEVVELKVRVAGYGNLQNIRNPQLNLPDDLVVYADPEVSDTIFYTISGAEGSKTFTYYIQVNQAGNILLNPIKIAYFNPKTEKYETSECKLGTIYAKPSDKELTVNTDVSTNETENATPTMRPYIAEHSIGKSKPNGIFTGLEGTLLLFSPLMLGLSLGLLVRFKNSKEEKQQNKKSLLLHKTEMLNELETLKNNPDNTTEISTISRLFIHFLAKQFDVNNAEITRSFLNSKTPDKISDKIYLKTLDVLDQLDEIKFGGDIENNKIEHLIDEIKQIVNSF